MAQATMPQRRSGRTASFAGNPKTITAGSVQTLTWTSSEIDSTGVVSFFVSLAGNGAATWQQLAFIDRIRVRAAGRVIVDVPLAVLQAFQAAYSNANFSDVSSAGANGALYIPLNLIDAPTQFQQDACQFPSGAEATVELVTTATAVAGAAILGWVTSNQEQRFFPRLISSASNWAAASVRNQKYPFSEEGIVRAVGFDTRGIDRAECYVSGQRAFNLPGSVYSQPAAAAANYSDMSVERDVAESGGLIGTYRFRSTDLWLPAASGSSYLTVDTSAAWPGAASEIATYALVPIEQFRVGV